MATIKNRKKNYMEYFLALESKFSRHQKELRHESTVKWNRNRTGRQPRIVEQKPRWCMRDRSSFKATEKERVDVVPRFGPRRYIQYAFLLSVSPTRGLTWLRRDEFEPEIHFSQRSGLMRHDYSFLKVTILDHTTFKLWNFESKS